MNVKWLLYQMYLYFAYIPKWPTTQLNSFCLVQSYFLHVRTIQLIRG